MYRVSFHPLLEMDSLGDLGEVVLDAANAAADFQDVKVSENGDDPQLVSPLPSSRPPIVFNSPGAFARSFAARWRSVWTRRFILSLLAGQVVSLCITCTNVTTTELVIRGWTLSTTQGFFTCISYFFAVFLIKNWRWCAQVLCFVPYLYPLHDIPMCASFFTPNEIGSWYIPSLFRWIQRMGQSHRPRWLEIFAQHLFCYPSLDWLNFVRYHSGSMWRRRKFFGDQGN